jgi:hypothetical protein
MAQFDPKSKRVISDLTGKNLRVLNGRVLVHDRCGNRRWVCITDLPVVDQTLVEDEEQTEPCSPLSDSRRTGILPMLTRMTWGVMAVATATLAVLRIARYYRQDDDIAAAEDDPYYGDLPCCSYLESNERSF